MSVERAPLLAHVPHGFCDRGLDCGKIATGDEDSGQTVRTLVPGDDERLRANRAKALALIAPGRRLALVEQVHGTAVHLVRDRADAEARPAADVLVTDNPSVALGIYTADCVPILLADEAGRAVGAAHAGWRGAAAGIVEAAVASVEALGVARSALVAAIGPAIAPASYEVDDPFVAGLGEAARGFLAPGRTIGRYQFDLPGFVEHALNRAGVLRVDRIALDTCALARYYSHRRATKRGIERTGRQISIIAPNPS